MRLYNAYTNLILNVQIRIILESVKTPTENMSFDQTKQRKIYFGHQIGHQNSQSGPLYDIAYKPLYEVNVLLIKVPEFQIQ